MDALAPLRGALRVARWLGWAVLALLAAAGLALSTIAFLAAAPFARPLVASTLIRYAGEAIAGRLELQGIAVLPHGGMELRDLRVYDPDGHLVLSVGHARLFVDVTALRARTLGLALELDAPSVILEQEADGGTSLARAFAPRRRGAAPEAARGAGGGGLGGWTVRLSSLVVRGGDLWWQDAAGATRAEATGIELAARGSAGPRETRAELRLAAQLRSPAGAPVSLEVLATRSGDAVRIPVLHAAVGGTALSAVAEGDLGRRRGRLAVIRLGVSREEARALVPRTPAGADLAATGYAESDGAALTAALRVEPAAAGGGRGDVAVAARLDGLRRAAGLDLALERLDPSRLAATLPAGEVTLSAHGAAAGASLEDLRARLALTAARSRLGRGELTRAEVVVRVARGNVDVDRLAAAVPGGAVEGSGRWRRGGPVSGSVAVDAADLALASRNGALLAGAEPPPLAGQARFEGTLSGTAAAPALDGRLDAAAVRAGAVSVEGAHLVVRAQGPAAALAGSVEGRVAVVREGAVERARQVLLRASLAGGEGAVTLTASVPAAGKEPVSVDARGTVDRARGRLLLGQLTLAYPGTRWTLVRPAAVDLRAPAVDRLELAAPPQRLAVEGGAAPRGALALRVEVSRLDLARLPAGLVPGLPSPREAGQDEGVRGEVSGRAEVSGPAARPSVAARLSVEGGAFGGVRGVAATVDGRWDGGARRASGTVDVARAQGGRLGAELDLPVPLAGRPAERVSVRLRVADLPLAEALGAAGRDDLPVDGKVGVEVRVDGTAGAPAASAALSLDGGVWDDLDGLGATVTLDAPGKAAHLVAAGALGGRRVAAVDATAPLDLGALVARPAETLRALARAPLRASASILSFDLAAVSGRLDVPPGLAGTVEARAELTGTARAPRLRGGASLAGGAWGAWRGLGATVEVAAADAGLSVDGRVTLQGEDALRVRGSLGLRPEGLGDRAAVAAAPLRLDAEVPRLALARAAGEALALAGTVEGRLAARGTLNAPELSADLAGAGVTVKGRPLGDAAASARWAGGKGDAALSLRPPAGGTLRATLALAAGLGLGASGPALLDAPAEAAARADDLDLGFLAALAPGLVRSAGGKLALDLTASGPLRRLSPRGTVHVAGGRLAVAELGDWTDVAVDARIAGDAVELTRLDVRRGKGTLSLTGAARGLGSDAAALQAHLAASAFGVPHAGTELATLDLTADATGTLSPAELTVELRVPGGTVRLPRRVPRTLQSLETRKDIALGRRPERRAAARPAAGAGEAGAARAVRLHAVVPGKLFVKSDDPKIDVELRADVRYELEEDGDYASGSVEAVRGSVEPFAGRTFVLDHGAVRFTNGPPDAALLDLLARYTNPAAVITARVTGTLHAPDFKLSSSVPSMTEQDCALFLVTGRTEAKAGAGGVGGISGEEAGKAALGALATQAFKDLVQDKLPLDTVAVDAGGFRAGKYVTDRIYVGYVRRWDADPTKNQNEDEVRVEYQITPRWMFESRYGNAQSGGANLIWSRDF